MNRAIFLSALLAMAAGPVQDAQQEPLHPEDLRLEITGVESEHQGDRIIVRFEARTVRPDGEPWGRGLHIQADAWRVAYRLLFRDDLFTYPIEPEDGRPLPAIGEIRAGGDLDHFELDCASPGLYRVRFYMDPMLQVDGSALNDLKRMLRLRRDDGAPYLDLGEQLVWAGRPRQILPEQGTQAQAYLDILTRARDTFQRVQQEVDNAQGDEWVEVAMRHVTGLLELKQQVQTYEQTSLLYASFNFMNETLDDLETMARTMRDRLEEQRRSRSGAGGGGGGGGGGGLQDNSGGTAGDASDEWGTPTEIPSDKEEMVPGEPMPMLAGTYGGGLRIERMQRLLDLAPLYAAREALLWFARYAEVGTQEINGLFNAWIAAPAGEAKDDARRALNECIRAWQEVCRDMRRTIQSLRESIEVAARRERDLFAERNWIRYFDGVAELYDDPNGTGLQQYAERVRLAAEDPAVAAEPDDLRAARETLESAAQGVEQRNRELVSQIHPEEEGAGNR